jgi:hypothetical protein
MGITSILWQTLQQNSKDIVNAMNIVSTKKYSFNSWSRDDGWEPSLDTVVVSFKVLASKRIVCNIVCMQVRGQIYKELCCEN